MDLLNKLESILFVASKSLSIKQLAKVVGKSEYDVAEAIEALRLKYNRPDSGIFIFIEGEMAQMGTNPDNSGVIDGFVKDEIGGELTKAQLETLTVVAYRGPVTRPELEQIRGVNCAVILRNLLIKGLVEEKPSEEKMMEVYSVSFDALAHLGVTSVQELSGFEELSKHEYIENTLATKE